jgi:hypothetical protein
MSAILKYTHDGIRGRSVERTDTKDKVNVRVTLRLAVYRQSVRLGAKLEAHKHEFFFQLNPSGHSPLTAGWGCILRIL